MRSSIGQTLSLTLDIKVFVDKRHLSLQGDKIVALSESKAFADDKSITNPNIRAFLYKEESIVGKGENVG